MIDASRRALTDLRSGLLTPRLWLMLSWNDLEARYRRTILGPFWHTLTLAAWIVGITVLFSTIRYRDDPTFLPYVAAGMITYAFLAGLLNEAATAYQRGEAILRAYDLPASIHIFRSVVGQFIMAGHSLGIFVLVAIYSSTYPSLATLLIVPAAVIYFVLGVGWTLCVSLLGARFRDVSPALTTVLAFMQLMTPVYWRRETLGDRAYLADWNPLYHLVEIIRAPLLGEAPAALSWIVSGLIAVFSLVIGVVAFVKYRRLVTYWI